MARCWTYSQASVASRKVSLRFAPVRTNDALAFTAVFARARFKGPREWAPHTLIDAIRQAYRETAEDEVRLNRDRLRDEQRAIDLGPEALRRYMAEAQHAANSATVRENGLKAANTKGAQHYRLVSYYFSAGCSV